MQLLNIGILGMGNCGGQMADTARGAGFDAIAVNASKDDLDTLTNNVERFMVGDGNGTGKNRDTAKTFLEEHSVIFEDERLNTFITNHDVIVIPTSIGGGFGSGTSLAATRTLAERYPKKLFIPAGVMPFDSELYTAQNHSIQWQQELEDMEVPYIMYDNDKFSGMPESVACDTVNVEFVRDLEVMRGDYIYSTRTGGIDPRDILTTISTPGRIVIASLTGVDVDDLIDKSLIKTLKYKIDEHSAHAELADDGEIMASATMYYLPEEFDPYKGAVRSDLQSVFGAHVTDYGNFADLTAETMESEGVEPSIAVILTGLSAPQTRIARLVKRRDKLASNITTRKTSASKVKGVDTTALDGKLKLNAKSFSGQDRGPVVK